MHNECLGLQTMLYMLTDEVAKDRHLLDHYRHRAATLLAIGGRCQVNFVLETIQIIGEYLMPARPSPWRGYLDLIGLPYAPVMPYDFGHHLHLELLFPGFTLSDHGVSSNNMKA